MSTFSGTKLKTIAMFGLNVALARDASVCGRELKTARTIKIKHLN